MNTRSNAKSATPGEQGDVPKQVNGPQITLENGTEVDIRNTKSLRDLLEGDDELSEDDLRIMAKSIGIENADTIPVRKILMSLVKYCEEDAGGGVVAVVSSSAAAEEPELG